MKKKLIIFLIIAIAVFISLPLFNYHVDIARVFSKSYDKHYKGQLPNELFLQSQFLMEHPEYTKIIFGSSRIGNGIDLTQHNGWYKAWHQGANLEEHLNTLKYILKKGKKIDEVVVAVDYLSFFSKVSRSDYFRQNPPISLEENIEFYNFYLFRKPMKKDFKHFVKRDFKGKRGHIFSNEAQSHSRNNDYFINQSMFMGSRKINQNIFDINIKALKEIEKLCEASGIKFSFFVNPFHYKNYYGQDIDFILKYKTELAKIQSYFDCSLEINKYTTNSKYWVDVSHYNKILGDLILADVFMDKKNLCKQVSIKNIESINKSFIHKNLKRLDSLSWLDMKIVPHRSYFKKKVLSEEINKSYQKYIFKDSIKLDKSPHKLFIKIDIMIHQATKIEIEFAGQKLGQKLKIFNDWPKVGRKQSIGVIVNSKDLEKNELVLNTDKKIKLFKIEIFKLKDLK